MTSLQSDTHNAGTRISPIWVTEQDVVELMGLPDAIQALEAAAVAEFEGRAKNMSKTMVQFNAASNLHALGGQLESVVGTKSWVHTKRGTCPMLLLWNSEDGQLVAVIEAFALGNLRTGGTSGLATRWLSSPRSNVMAIAGTGKQALSQVAAVTAVRPITEIRVFSPTPENRKAFALEVENELSIKASVASSMEDAAYNADVVTLVTRATEPFLFSRFLKDGAHVNAVGAIATDREEFSQDLFDRAGTVCVDYLDSVKKLSREFSCRFESRNWNEVTTLGQVIAEGKSTWNPRYISIFKAMGMGLSDVALGEAIVRLAQKFGKGRLIDKPKKVPIRLRASSDAN